MSSSSYDDRGHMQTPSAQVGRPADRALCRHPPHGRARVRPPVRQRRLAVAEPAAPGRQLHRRLLRRCRPRLADQRRHHLPYRRRRGDPRCPAACQRRLQGHHVRRPRTRLGGRIPGHGKRHGHRLPHGQCRQELEPRTPQVARRSHARQLRHHQDRLGDLLGTPCCTPQTEAFTGPATSSPRTFGSATCRRSVRGRRGSPKATARCCAPSTAARPGGVSAPATPST